MWGIYDDLMILLGWSIYRTLTVGPKTDRPLSP